MKLANILKSDTFFSGARLAYSNEAQSAEAGDKCIESRKKLLDGGSDFLFR